MWVVDPSRWTHTVDGMGQTFARIHADDRDDDRPAAAARRGAGGTAGQSPVASRKESREMMMTLANNKADCRAGIDLVKGSAGASVREQ